jgi:hypothetical protein
MDQHRIIIGHEITWQLLVVERDVVPPADGFF